MTSATDKNHRFSVRSQRAQMLLYMVVFGLIGTLALIFSHAATSSGSIDPEGGTLGGNAVVVTDSSAAGGKAIKFQAAVSGGATGRCTSSATRICYNGKLWYMNGINMPWRSWSADFGNGGVIANKADIGSRFAQVHSSGSTVVRWWMFEGGAWQINRAADGTPTSLNQAIYPDIDAALALADQYNLYYDFTLFGAVDTTAFPSSWRTNATQRQALANVLAPLFAHYKDNPRIMSWELYNEPEWQTSNNTDGANVADVMALSKVLITAIRANAPKTMITIGEARMTDIATWKSLDLDFDSPHYYDNFGTSADYSPYSTTAAAVQARYGTTRPILIGEFPFVGNTAANLTRLSTTYSNGFAGAWDWSLFYDQTGDQIKPDFSAQTTFAGQHTDFGPK